MIVFFLTLPHTPQLNLQQTAATTMVSASQSATKTANKAKATSLSYARLAAAQRNLTVHLKTHQGLTTTTNNNNQGDNNNMGDEGTSTSTINATTTAVSRVLNTLFQEEDATATHRFEQQLNVLLDVASTVRRLIFLILKDLL
jgi:hypothetical protein